MLLRLLRRRLVGRCPDDRRRGAALHLPSLPLRPLRGIATFLSFFVVPFIVLGFLLVAPILPEKLKKLDHVSINDKMITEGGRCPYRFPGRLLSLSYLTV